MADTTQAPEGLSEDDRQQALSAASAIQPHVAEVEATGSTMAVNEAEAKNAEIFVEPQRVQEMNAPGE